MQIEASQPVLRMLWNQSWAPGLPLSEDRFHDLYLSELYAGSLRLVLGKERSYMKRTLQTPYWSDPFRVQQDLLGPVNPGAQLSSRYNSAAHMWVGKLPLEGALSSLAVGVD